MNSYENVQNVDNYRNVEVDNSNVCNNVEENDEMSTCQNITIGYKISITNSLGRWKRNDYINLQHIK